MPIVLAVDESDGLNFAYALNKIAIVMRALGFRDDCLATHEHCLDIRLKLLGNVNCMMMQVVVVCNVVPATHQVKGILIPPNR